MDSLVDFGWHWVLGVLTGVVIIGPSMDHRLTEEYY